MITIFWCRDLLILLVGGGRSPDKDGAGGLVRVGEEVCISRSGGEMVTAVVRFVGSTRFSTGHNRHIVFDLSRLALITTFCARNHIFMHAYWM